MSKSSYTYHGDTPILLSDFLKSVGVSKSLLTKLKREYMGITREGELVRSIDLVYPNDTITLSIKDTSFLEPNGNLTVPIAYEDTNVVVFDKPCGMPVHPSILHRDDTLGNYFAYLYPDTTFRAVIRLDRNTSGLCIVAKNQRSAGMLQRQVSKTYYAVVQGLVEPKGTINLPIRRAEGSIIKREVYLYGKPSITYYRCLAYSDQRSLVEVTLGTGRTHQIRVHFAYIGHPLCGDDLYGGDLEGINRQALHCGKLKFPDVDTGKVIEVTSTIPDDMLRLVTNNR